MGQPEDTDDFQENNSPWTEEEEEAINDDDRDTNGNDE